jgi:hypothetical protein
VSDGGSDRDEVHVQALVLRDDETGLDDVHICVGARDIELLRKGVRAGFQQFVVDDHLKREEFSGEVVFAVLSEVTPQTPALWQAMAELEQHLMAVISAAKLTTTTGRPVRLSFTYTDHEDGR